MAVRFGLLRLALRDLPVGTAYAVWAGIKAVGIGLLGSVLFSASATATPLACIGLIVIDLIELKVVS